MSRRLFGVMAAVALLAACDEERADINSPDYPDSYGFSLGLTASNLPRGTARFLATGAESIVVVISGLDSLGAGSYVPWVGAANGSGFKRLTGALSVARFDTTFNAAGIPIPVTVNLDLGTVSSWKNGSPQQTFTFRTTRAAAGLAPGDPISHFVLSIETDGGAGGTPNPNSSFLFARMTAGANVALRFGNYAPTLAEEYLYSPAIRGRGHFRGDVFQLTDSTMPRPPKGFYYGAFFYRPVFGAVAGDTAYIMDQHSPYPKRHLTQYDADMTSIDPDNVLDTPRMIVAGGYRISADTLSRFSGDTPYAGFTEVWVTLQAKEGIRNRMATWRIATGSIPGVITTGDRR